MKTLTLLTAGLFAVSLAACGQEAPAETISVETHMEMTGSDMMDHSGHDMPDQVMGHGTGIIKSRGSKGDFLTIDHGPIDGIGMGAMTMGFEIMGSVDVSAFAEGDPVAFMVKKGRDNSYRITNMCNTQTEGTDCLAGMMDH
ncbi:copper-binding protein [Hyphomonas sp.]|uniref:copper-binding protein n=1 Tax=Hyphomonas sp. TaxID=87 RepID=UPI0030F92620